MIQPMRVRDFMSRPPVTIAGDVEIMRAVRRLVDEDISGLLVVDEDGRLSGVLTERDCIAVALQAGYHDEAGGLVRDFMSSDLTTIEADASMMDLAETFAKSSYRRFPVTDDGKLVGLISRRAVLRALSDGSWFSMPANQTRND